MTFIVTFDAIFTIQVAYFDNTVYIRVYEIKLSKIYLLFCNYKTDFAQLIFFVRYNQYSLFQSPSQHDNVLCPADDKVIQLM